MNISTDKIAEQWSHRVGIIDKNNPLHIIELKKILNKHKLEESVIDQYISNLLGEKILKTMALNEARSVASSSEIEWCIAALQSGNVIDAEIIKKIKELCLTDVDVFEGIKNAMIDKSVPTNKAHEIAKNAHKLCDDPSVFLKYVKKPMIDIKSVSGISDIISSLPAGIGSDFT